MHATDAVVAEAAIQPTDDLPAAAPAAPELKRYGYRVGGFGFLVREQTRSEVVRAPVIATVPHSPRWLLGIMNLRGNLVPVADMAALCGAPETRAPATVLVLDTGERAIAVPIDGLPRPVTGLRPAVEALPLPEAIAPHAGAILAAEEGVWITLDHEEFFRALARGPGAQY